MQIKRKAKLPTVIGLTTKHAVCCKPANVSAITSSAKTPNQAETVQISTRTATRIWAGPPLALTCTLFDKILPGCYKSNRNKVRKASFCISCSSEQLRSQNTNSDCTRAYMPNSQQSSLHLQTFHNCVCQIGSKNSLCTAATWAQIVP